LLKKMEGMHQEPAAGIGGRQALWSEQSAGKQQAPPRVLWPGDQQAAGGIRQVAPGPPQVAPGPPRVSAPMDARSAITPSPNLAPGNWSSDGGNRSMPSERAASSAAPMQAETSSSTPFMEKVPAHKKASFLTLVLRQCRQIGYADTHKMKLAEEYLLQHNGDVDAAYKHVKDLLTSSVGKDSNKQIPGGPEKFLV
jgi:hypothetical protein